MIIIIKSIQNGPESPPAHSPTLRYIISPLSCCFMIFPFFHIFLFFPLLEPYKGPLKGLMQRRNLHEFWRGFAFGNINGVCIALLRRFHLSVLLGQVNREQTCMYIYIYMYTLIKSRAYAPELPGICYFEHRIRIEN